MKVDKKFQKELDEKFKTMTAKEREIYLLDLFMQNLDLKGENKNGL